MELYLLIANLVAVIVGLVFLTRKNNSQEQEALVREVNSLRQELQAVKQDVGYNIQSLGSMLNDNVYNINQHLVQLLDVLGKQLQEKQEAAAKAELEQLVLLEKQFKNMQEELDRQLNLIRGTVDEKLQTTLEKRITESFKTVSSQLEQVYKGLGEMQSLANDVGSLKKVLGGVKTRGNLGEYQLGAILAEILAPEQYATNVATIPGSRERVEFAVKLPHEEGLVYLPIDSKFPAETYEQLKDAQESGDRRAVEEAYKRLETVIRQEAKDIATKYIAVPHTTSFGIMFLPAEGLYAEVVSRGLIAALQHDYNINIAGPSTMAALLTSLQMGFKTLAIQKQSSKAWEVLGAVKTEFGKFEDGLKKMQTRLNQTSVELDALINTRSNAMSRKLRGVEKLDDLQAKNVLEIGD